MTQIAIDNIMVWYFYHQNALFVAYMEMDVQIGVMVAVVAVDFLLTQVLDGCNMVYYQQLEWTTLAVLL